MQAEFNPSKHVKNLPDAYLKSPESNNRKILELENYECNKLREGLWSIDEILDLDKATGKTLDLYGERVGQARGQASDDKYRLLIKARIMRNLSNGTYPSVMDALCRIFSCDPSQIVMIDDEAPCSAKITSFPLGIINKSGLSSAQTLALVKSLLPVTVTLTSFMFDGTFQFSDVEDEYNEERGFTDVEDGTIGGYFGVTSGDEKDVILPI